jgi:hypothetical protein
MPDLADHSKHLIFEYGLYLAKMLPVASARANRRVRLDVVIRFDRDPVARQLGDMAAT